MIVNEIKVTINVRQHSDGNNALNIEWVSSDGKPIRAFVIDEILKNARIHWQNEAKNNKLPSP